MNYSLKPTLLAALCAATLLTTACKKDKTDNPTPTPAAASMSYKVGTTTVTPTVVAGGQQFGVTSITSGGAATTPQLSISLGSVTGTGVISAPTISYSENSVAWSNALGGTATVNVTAYDATAKKISGTFSGTLFPFIGNTATTNKVISAGTFTNVTIQ